MLDIQRSKSPDAEEARDFPEVVKEVQSSPGHAITPKLTPITPVTTPSTAGGVLASPASSVHSTLSGDETSSHVSGHSSRSSRITLPSPARSRIDPQYAARLGSQTQQQQRFSDSSIMPPPFIARGSTSKSIFRSTSISSPAGMRSCASSGGASLVGTSNDSFRSSYCSASSQPSLSFVGSFGSLSTPAGRYTAQYQDVGQSDRFIPSRATSNLSLSLWDSSRVVPGGGNARNDSNRANSDDANGSSSDDANDTTATVRNDSAGSSQQPLLNELLRAELLGENSDPTGSPVSLIASQPTADSSRDPLRESGNRFRFQSPRQAYHNGVFDRRTSSDAIINSFSLTPMGSATSHRLLSMPQKRARRIQKVPFKVLDAPALQDDFYLNLVDW